MYGLDSPAQVAAPRETAGSKPRVPGSRLHDGNASDDGAGFRCNFSCTSRGAEGASRIVAQAELGAGLARSPPAVHRLSVQFIEALPGASSSGRAIHFRFKTCEEAGVTHNCEVHASSSTANMGCPTTGYGDPMNPADQGTKRLGRHAWARTDPPGLPYEPRRQPSRRPISACEAIVTSALRHPWARTVLPASLRPCIPK